MNRDLQPGRPDDVQYDPVLDGGDTADWSSEGGATPDGPAIDSEGGNPS